MFFEVPQRRFFLRLSALGSSLLLSVFATQPLPLKAEPNKSVTVIDGIHFTLKRGLWVQDASGSALVTETAVHKSLKWRKWMRDASATEQRILSLGPNVLYQYPPLQKDSTELRGVFANALLSKVAKHQSGQDFLSAYLEESKEKLTATKSVLIAVSESGVAASALGSATGGGAAAGGVAAGAATVGGASVAGSTIVGLTIPTVVGVGTVTTGAVIAGTVAYEGQTDSKPLSPAN